MFDLICLILKHIEDCMAVVDGNEALVQICGFQFQLFCKFEAVEENGLILPLLIFVLPTPFTASYIIFQFPIFIFVGKFMLVYREYFSYRY